MDARKVVGIDIGGSHITAGIVDLKSREVLPATLIREYVNSKDSAEKIIDAWAYVINKLFNEQPQASRKIGMAMPGPFDYENGICLIQGVDKFESLFGLNIKKLLSDKLKIEAENILMMNDASCFLKGEIFGGAAVDCDNVLGVTLGTGLGSARFYNGKIFDGDLYCSAFKNGIAEDYLSSRWFLKQYKDLTGESVKNVKELREKNSENTSIKLLFSEFGKNLGQALSGYAQKHNCDTIIIGGNIANSWELFFHETKAILDIHQKKITVKKAVLGEEGALIGAASLWQ